ncbi:hypothetical protein BCON_0838g00020 [Botryotinia convoluta]|uniref:Uncharacterized protein n=1 Tax=Botryotinia convoluta TaxID=54673 RepID=A0A4Z1H6Y5_9HELO|nr:hypothetical protein BCON_0838g00020 [Botryotinia convoluta]
MTDLGFDRADGMYNEKNCGTKGHHQINETLEVLISIACEEWPKKLDEAEATIKRRNFNLPKD